MLDVLANDIDVEYGHRVWLPSMRRQLGGTITQEGDELPSTLSAGVDSLAANYSRSSG